MTTPAQLRSPFLQEACIAHEPVPAQEFPGRGKRNQSEKAKSSFWGRGGGFPNPLSTQSAQGSQALTSGTHRANSVQSMAPDPVEPSRTQSHGHSHPSMAQVGSPSSCQTKARDPGIPVGLQRPPTSHPNGAHVVRPKVAMPRASAPFCSPPRAEPRLCPAQRPHRLWAKTKGSSAGLQPVEQGTKTCPQWQGVRWLWLAAGRLAGGTTSLTRTSRKQRSTPSLSFCPSEL